MSKDDEQLRQRIAELEEENGNLRRAAETFGRLAERLNSELAAERRAGNERRKVTRGPDRRQNLGACTITKTD